MAAAQHLVRAYPQGTRVNEAGHLEVGGCDVLELAREFGTPAYVVAEDDLRARAKAFVEAFAAQTDRFEVSFASKAFPCTAVYRVLAEEGVGCDVAGGGELMTALRGGFDPAKIILHGNAKTVHELELAIEHGVRFIVVDSMDELERLREVLRAHDARQDVLLRIAPGVSPDTHPAISTGGPNTKFGFNLDAAREAIAALDGDDRAVLKGLHFHIGSQILDLEPFRRAMDAIAGLGEFDVYDLGGGLGVTYTDERPPSISDYATAKVAMVEDVVGPGKLVIDEPGRALTANSCVTLYTVQTVKDNVDRWVGVDGGMSDNMRVIAYGAKYHVDVASRPNRGGTRVHVTGKHCESGDLLVRDADLPDPRVGDVLVTPATGAYGFSMSNNYNGALRPPVVFCSGGDARVVVRRETYDDLFDRDV